MIDYHNQKFFSALDGIGRNNADRIQEIYDRFRQDEGDKTGFVLETYPDDPVSLYFQEEGCRGNAEQLIRFILECCRSVSLSGVWSFSWVYEYEAFREGGCAGGACVIDLERGAVLYRIDLLDWVKRHKGEERQTLEPTNAETCRKALERVDSCLGSLEYEIRQERVSLEETISILRSGLTR